MITALHIKNTQTTPLAWWPKVKAFTGISRFDFAPEGLTILWGPNGSGKSTLLKMLARLTHCEQGGVPRVTEHSVREMSSESNQKVQGVRLTSDGKPVHFFDPAARVGLIGGAFDYDFMGDGLFQIQHLDRASSGEAITMKFQRMASSAAQLKEVPWKICKPKDTDQDPYSKEIRSATASLRCTTKREGLHTFLMDEPDRSLSIPRQIELWETLTKQRKFQIIVATHAIFALNIPGARYIDVQKGYLEECRATYDAWSRGAFSSA